MNVDKIGGLKDQRLAAYQKIFDPKRNRLFFEGYKFSPNFTAVYGGCSSVG